MILIIAGSYAQAERWAYDHGIRRHSEFRYVLRADDLRGRRGTPYVKIGDYYKRRDWRRIEEMLIPCGVVWTDPDTYVHEPAPR